MYAFSSYLETTCRTLRKILPRLPDSKHPAASQPTPFGINRYVLLLIYVIYTFVTSCTYFGWRNLSHMLIKSGAYDWECDESQRSLYDENGEEKRFLCDTQDTNVQNLFTIAMACHFTMTAFAGTLIDIVGPKLTALLGQILNFLGWILLAFSGNSFRAYIAAFIFIGAGADTGFLPCVVLANLFPGSSALCLAILGSAVSASFAIPLVLDTIWTSFGDGVSFFSLCIGYLIAGPTICAVVALLFLPCKSFKGADSMIFELQQASAETVDDKNGANINYSCACSNDVKKNAKSTKFGDDDDQVATSTAASELVTRLSEASYCKLNKKGVENMEDAEGSAYKTGAISLSDGDANIKNDKRIANSSNNEKDIEMNAPRDSSDKNISKVENLDRCIKQETSFKKILLSKPYMCICLYFIMCSLSMAYYQNAAGRLFSLQVENTLSMLVPFSFVPCIILGKTVDKFGVVPVIIFINTCGVCMYMLACFSVTGLHYICTVLYMIYISVYTSQLYCYVNETFTSRHFGKLLGIGSGVGGLLSLITQFLYTCVTVNLMHGNTLLINIIFVCSLTALYPMLVYLLRFNRRVAKAALKSLQLYQQSS